jgi:hypothetical protein
MAKRRLTPFSLAFLDVMFCGFGAVVLLVMILNGEVLQKREAQTKDLRGELSRVTVLEELASTHLTNVKNRLKNARLEEGTATEDVKALKTRIAEANKSQLEMKGEFKEARRRSELLKRQKVALENTTRIIKEGQNKQLKSGRKLVGFTGDGERQYLTGLKLGGKKTLILVDVSASMLDETIVNIIRRRLMSKAAQLKSLKWQRTLRSVHWLIANLPPDSQYQVYVFNNDTKPVLNGTRGKWLNTNNRTDLNALLAVLRATIPSKGTNLLRAFSSVKAFEPRPDSIILLTDGLPTQGSKAQNKGPVTSDERLEFFKGAVKSLKMEIPVNIILFPIEGDPKAAVSFWELAIQTKGSFLTPSRDWP